MKFFKLLHLILVLIIAMPAGAQTIDLPREDTIKLGVILDTVNDSSVVVESKKNAILLAAAGINQQGGILNRQLELIFEFHSGDIPHLVSNFERLVRDRGIRAIIGNLHASVVDKLLPYAATLNIPILTSKNVMGIDPQYSAFVFSFAYQERLLTTAIQNFLNQQPKITNIASNCWSSNFGSLAYDLVRSRGIEILGYDSCDENTAVNAIRQMLHSGAHQAIIITRGSLKGVGSLLQSYEEPPLILGHQDSEGYYKELSHTTNYYFVTWQPSRSFLRLYNQEYQKQPALLAENDYDMIYALASALRRRSPDIMKSLDQVRFLGASGVIDFSRITPFRNINFGEGVLKTFSRGDIDIVR